MKRIKHITGGFLLLILAISGCDDPLEQENLTAITSEDVWTYASVAEAYVNDIYANFMPGVSSGEERDTDEALSGGLNIPVISSYLNGTITADSYNYYPYNGIRSINIFLEGIDEEARFDAEIRDRLKGETLFWRAWAYFQMVRAYGGVPLVIRPEDPNDEQAVFIPRSPASACFDQIVQDLDDAIALLPDPSGNARIDKGVAMAFKGRVTLFEASPQFNRSDNSALWQAAYDANKAAADYLIAQGFGLLEDFSQLWMDEMNKEVIMVRRYSYPEAPNGMWQVCIMPLIYGESGCAHANQPSLELVNAFPMKDGSKWDPDARDYAFLHQDRDDRFYATIAYNGADPYLKPMFNVENLWTYYYDKDEDPNTGINGREIRADFMNGNFESRSSFYTTKMIDPNLDAVNKEQGEIDWIEIRFAEVLMNLAEAANETDQLAEALGILYQIRQRARIEVGTGTYGITATTKEQIRQAIMDERFVEFAFERKRFWDLRRWRVYKSRMEGFENSVRHGLRIEWTGATAERPTGLENIDDIADQFLVTVIEDVQQNTMLEEDKYSFLGIPSTYLERNSKLEQNKTWGGSFDPLQ